MLMPPNRRQTKQNCLWHWRILVITTSSNRTLYIEGLILRARGDLTGASKKFRAVLASDPSLTLVRADLAKTLASLDETDSAKHHLSLLAAEAPDEASQSAIKGFIEQLDAKRPWRLSAYASLSPSTNVNGASIHDRSKFSVFGTTFEYDNPEQSSGIGATTGINFGFARRLNNDFMGVFGTGAEANLYREEQYRSYNTQHSAELRYMTERGYLGLGIAASYSNTSLDGESRQNAINFGPRVSLSHAVSSQDMVFGSAGYEWRKNEDAPYISGNAINLRAGIEHAFNSTFRVGLVAGYEDARLEEKHNSYDAWSIGLSAYKELPAGITVDASAGLRISDFDARLTVFPEIRKDHRASAGLTLTKRDLNLFGFAPQVSYNYTRNFSNLEIYDTENHAVDLRLTKEF
jgi:outer membrane protein